MRLILHHLDYPVKPDNDTEWLLLVAGLDFPALPSTFLRPPKICVSPPRLGGQIRLPQIIQQKPQQEVFLWARALSGSNPGHDLPLNKPTTRAGLFNGGQRGIRTPVTLARKHAFQACAFSRSAICPMVNSL